MYTSLEHQLLEFLGKNGKLTGVKVQPIDWKPNPEGGRPLMVEAGEPRLSRQRLYSSNGLSEATAA